MSDSFELENNQIKSVLLAHGSEPLLDYSASLLMRPVITLERTSSLHESFSAICQRHYDLVVIEPQLANGDAALLAAEIAHNLRTNRPTILRIGSKEQLRSPWPFSPHLFDTGDGLSAFNQRLIDVLRLHHRRARRFAIRVNFRQQGANAILGQSVMISSRGMLFASGKKLGIGATVELEILGAKSLRDDRFTGVVLRQEPLQSSLPHYAIEFRHISSEQQMRMDHYLADDSGGLLNPPEDIV